MKFAFRTWKLTASCGKDLNHSFLFGYITYYEHPLRAWNEPLNEQEVIYYEQVFIKNWNVPFPLKSEWVHWCAAAGWSCGHFHMWVEQFGAQFPFAVGLLPQSCDRAPCCSVNADHTQTTLSKILHCEVIGICAWKAAKSLLCLQLHFLPTYWQSKPMIKKQMHFLFSLSHFSFLCFFVVVVWFCFCFVGWLVVFPPQISETLIQKLNQNLVHFELKPGVRILVHAAHLTAGENPLSVYAFCVSLQHSKQYWW